MITNPVHNIEGTTAVKISASIEDGIRAGRLKSGEQLPPVRKLAKTLSVAPATVASAYQALQNRGLVISHGRRGTRVSYRPLANSNRPTLEVGDARDLSDGNPDPALLPDMSGALKAIDPSIYLYGRPLNNPELEAAVRRDFERCHVGQGNIAFVNGAMDGLDRVLGVVATQGDRIGVEDPSFGNVMDLVTSRGLSLVPMRTDEEGVLPEELERACRDGVRAVVITPRVQNPMGCVLSEDRAELLRDVVARYPHVVVMEDDHAAYMTDAPLNALHIGAKRWVYVRSFSKAINPDLRLAAMTGDDTTLTKVMDRMLLGERWVSHIVQRIAAYFLGDEAFRAGLRKNAAVYTERREMLKAELEKRGVEAFGRSGYNVWIPVVEETATVQSLLQRGWLVAPGERFRIQSTPAIRVTCATLAPEETKQIAQDIASVVKCEACCVSV